MQKRKKITYKIMLENYMFCWHYFDEYIDLSFSKIKDLSPKFHSKNLFINNYNHDTSYEELDDKTLQKNS